MSDRVRYQELRVRSSREVLDDEFFDRRNKLIADAINRLGVEVDDIKLTSDQLIALGLERIDDLLGPALITLQSAAELGFLTATSATSATLTLSQTLTLEVDEGPNRDLFTPTPFLAVMRSSEGAQDDWAIARLDTYNKENGGLSITIVAVHGEVANSAHDDWVIAASSGIVPYLAEQVATLSQSVVDAEALLTDLEALAAAIEAGPVSTVNGQTGTVVIGIGDISGLNTALGNKADLAHGHAIADITNLQTTLNGKAATSHAHVIADTTGLQTALDGKAALAHVHAIEDITGLADAIGANRVYAQNVTPSSVAAVIPLDNTVPVNTEGTQILSATITPTTNTAKIRLEVLVDAQNSYVNSVVSVFRGTTCIAATSAFYSTVPMVIEDSPGSASAQTYSVRVGTTNGSYPTSVNGGGGYYTLGGKRVSSLLAQQVSA